MLETYTRLKGFIVDAKHLVVASGMKEALLLAVEKGIVNEEGLQVMPMKEEMLETSFYRRIGDLNNIEEVKALLTFYKDETISLSYNGKYVLSQETVGGYIRSKKEGEAVLLCSRETVFNNVIGKETWMKVDEENPVELGNSTKLENLTTEDEVLTPTEGTPDRKSVV